MHELFSTGRQTTTNERYSRYTIVSVGPSWSWSYGSWIYNYLCKQFLSSLMLWVRTQLRRGVLDTTLCDKVCQWLETGRWFLPVSSTNKTDRHDKTEILLKVALNTIILTLTNVSWLPVLLLEEAAVPQRNPRTRRKLQTNLLTSFYILMYSFDYGSKI